MAAPKTLDELAIFVANGLQDLRDGKLDIKVAAEIHNGAGKIYNAVRTQISAAALNKEKVISSFLNKPEDK